MNFDQPILTIDLNVIKQNYLSISSLIGRSKIIAVVKADSYGIGAKKVMPCLFAAGCRDFMVSSIDEAILLRGYLADANANNDSNKSNANAEHEVKIYTLNGIFDSTQELYHQYDIIPVINHAQQLQIWNSAKKVESRVNRAVLHLDTGMNRLGIDDEDFAKICSGKIDVSNLDIVMLMSHLASSENSETPTNRLQLNKFIGCCFRIFQALPHKMRNTSKSLANSGGVFLGQEYHFDMIRSGGALFGLHSHPKDKKYVKNPLNLMAPIIQLRTIRRGEKIGYGGIFCAVNDMKIATIPVGYADGFHRIIGDSGKVYINNVAAKIVGRVSMDLMTIDVTHIPEADISLGAAVEVIGPNQTPDQLAQDANSIGYEIITSLGNRYHRVYT